VVKAASDVILAALLLALAQEQPSVLVVVADDVGWPEWEHMPALRALAAGGVTFTRAYAQPVCSITRVSLMYGRYPRRFGIGNLLDASTGVGPRIPQEEVSLAELFGATHESGIFGKVHLGRADLAGQLNMQVSQPWCDGWQTGRAIQYGLQSYYSWSRCDNGALSTSTVYAVDAQRAQAAAYWNNRPGPKLVWLGWSAAHVAGGGNGYQPPPGLSYTGTDRGDYLQIVGYMDQQLAAVLAVVDPDNTIVVWCADNGTPDDQDPADGPQPLGTPAGIWKGTTREGGVRVPLVIAGPGIARGVASQRLVSLLDLGPTLAELLEQPTRGFGDGSSFADELGAWPGDPTRDFVFCERYRDVQDDQAVIEMSWKLRRVDPDGEGPLSSADLYYHISAPGVEMPLVPSCAIQARLQEELASLPARAP
jgi:arylsulfatase A-like enzyme